MMIKHPALEPHLLRNIKSIYVLVGLDHYLLNEAAYSIKKAWRQRGETSEKIIDINMPSDWNILSTEANSYSLFEELVLLDVRFDKKTIDRIGKETLSQYLQHVNSRCLIILRANAIPAKQLQWLADIESVVLVQMAPLNEAALLNWITSQLKTRSLRFDPQVPAIIHRFSQNNMLACAQSIEKLALIYDNINELSVEDVNAQLIDQSDFQLYELADACLTANGARALHLLQQAHNNRIEPTLVLWILTQEIRQLIQLTHLLKQSMPLATACSQLKIWPKRNRLYEMTLARISLSSLYKLLQSSKQLDESIKTSQGQQIWYALESLALALSKQK